MNSWPEDGVSYVLFSEELRVFFHRVVGKRMNWLSPAVEARVLEPLRCQSV